MLRLGFCREIRMISYEMSSRKKGEEVMRNKAKLEDYGDILTFEDLCLLLNIKRTYAYSLLQSGAIKSFKIGRQWRIMKSELITYINSQTMINSKE